MRTLKTLALTLALAASAGCAGGSSNRAERMAEPVASSPNSAAPAEARGGAASGELDMMKAVSLEKTEEPAPTPPQGDAPAPVARKIIRNATLTVEVEQPSKASQRIASIAEARGGFVVTSDARQQTGANGQSAYEVITVELRVPAAQFDAALAEIRGSGGSVTAEKITGKDVTEEYIDLEARLRTQRALEAQLLEIMKRADSVSDAVSVQRELTNVRTEIERVEGRRRFLENQSSLSTISVTLQPPAPLIGTRGFFGGIGRAFGDGVDIAASITLFFIWLLVALIPVALFVVLPAYYLLRYLARRLRARPAPPAPTHYQPQPPQEFQEPPPAA